MKPRDAIVLTGDGVAGKITITTANVEGSTRVKVMVKAEQSVIIDHTTREGERLTYLVEAEAKDRRDSVTEIRSSLPV